MAKDFAVTTAAAAGCEVIPVRTVKAPDLATAIARERGGFRAV